jgi:hypothetical protein
LSIVVKNRLNSTARCRRCSWPITVPSATLNAANRLVIPCRAESWVRRSGLPGQHRQHRLGAVQRLDLGLLVHPQHHGLVGRVVVQPDDVDDLVDNQRIGRQLEGLGQLRFEPQGPPAPTDRRLAQPRPFRHRLPRPVGRVGRGLLQRRHHHRLDLLDRDRRRPTRPGLVHQPVQPPLHQSGRAICRPSPEARPTRRPPGCSGSPRHRPARSCSAGPAPGTTSPAAPSAPASPAPPRSAAARPLAAPSSP